MTTGLSGDEAHYLLYARHLDWSYFDHPPLVGWLQAPMVRLTESVEFLRVLPQLVWLVSAGLLWQLSLEVSGDRRVAAWSIILFSTSPLLHIHGMALLPDTLLGLWSLLAALVALRILRNPNAWLPWLWLGLLLGLGGLSKYSAVFLALGLAAYLLWAIPLGRAWPWPQALLAVFVGLVLVSPVFLWNAANDWISFSYQGGHVSGGEWRFKNLAGFFLGQLLTYGPAMFLGLIAFAWGWRGRESVSLIHAHVGLLAVFLAFLGVLAWLSGGGRSLPYWTSPGWLIALPFIAAGVCGLGRVARRVLVGMLALWVGITVLVAAALQSGSLGPLVGFSGPTAFGERNRGLANPFAEVHGWDIAGEALLELDRRDRPGADFGAVSVGNWTMASRLGWYAWPMPVLVIDRRFDQFDLWWKDRTRGGGAAQPANDRVWFVEWSEMQTGKYLDKRLQCGEAPATEVRTPPRGWTVGGDLSVFRIYECRLKPGD